MRCIARCHRASDRSRQQRQVLKFGDSSRARHQVSIWETASRCAIHWFIIKTMSDSDFGGGIAVEFVGCSQETTGRVRAASLGKVSATNQPMAIKDRTLGSGIGAGVMGFSRVLARYPATRHRGLLNYTPTQRLRRGQILTECSRIWAHTVGACTRLRMERPLRCSARHSRWTSRALRSS